MPFESRGLAVSGMEAHGCDVQTFCLCCLNVWVERGEGRVPVSDRSTHRVLHASGVSTLESRKKASSSGILNVILLFFVIPVPNAVAAKICIALAQRCSPRRYLFTETKKQALTLAHTVLQFHPH